MRGGNHAVEIDPANVVAAQEDGMVRAHFLDNIRCNLRAFINVVQGFVTALFHHL